MHLEIPYPHGTVMPVTGKTFILNDMPGVFDIEPAFDPNKRVPKLYQGSRKRNILMSDEYDIELTAYRAHFRDQKFVRTDLTVSPYYSISVLRGMAEAESRVPAKCLKGARALLKGRNASRHSILALAHVLAYHEAGLYVIDVHSFKENEEGTCTCVHEKKPRGCNSPGKHPRGMGWEQRASKDWKITVPWWNGTGFYDTKGDDGSRKKMASASTPRNVGIVFVEDDTVFAVDVDGDKGKAGLAQLEAEYGPLPETATSISGSGNGYHKLFRAPPGVDIRNSASALAPGVDIRGRGGQIVAPPSVHKSGNLYYWEDRLAPWETPVADAPEWFVDMVTKQDSGAPTKGKKPAKSKRKHGCKPAAKDRTIKRGRTFEDRLAQIGDGDGQLGFHDPINAAIVQFYRKSLPRD